MTSYKHTILKNMLERAFGTVMPPERIAVFDLLTHGISYEDFRRMIKEIPINISKSDMIKVENAYRDIAS